MFRVVKILGNVPVYPSRACVSDESHYSTVGGELAKLFNIVLWSDGTTSEGQTTERFDGQLLTGPNAGSYIWVRDNNFRELSGLEQLACSGSFELNI